jgi:hypothetical protein
LFPNIAAEPSDALIVTALSEGKWGNDIHVGISHIAGQTDGDKLFDILIRRFDGDKVVAEEIFQSVHKGSGKVRHGEILINGTSGMVEVVGKSNRLPAPTQIDGADASLAQLLEAGKSALAQLTGGSNEYVPSSSGYASRAVAGLIGSQAARTGIYALENIVPDIFNMMCIPACAKLSDTNAKSVYEEAVKYCGDKFAFFSSTRPTTPMMTSTTTGSQRWAEPCPKTPLVIIQ